MLKLICFSVRVHGIARKPTSTHTPHSRDCPVLYRLVVAARRRAFLGVGRRIVQLQPNRLHLEIFIHHQQSDKGNQKTIQVKVKVKVRALDRAPLRDSSPQKRSGMARVLKDLTRFYLHTHTLIRNRNEPYLPLPS